MKNDKKINAAQSLNTKDFFTANYVQNDLPGKGFSNVSEMSNFLTGTLSLVSTRTKYGMFRFEIPEKNVGKIHKMKPSTYNRAEFPLKTKL